MFGMNPGETSGFVWRGRGDAWSQSSGYRWEWTGVHEHECKKECPTCPDPVEEFCAPPPAIDIERKKNLARACVAAVDNNYYYSKTWDGITSKVFHESTAHDLFGITYSNQQIIYDVSRDVGGMDKTIHLYTLENGIYDTMFAYNGIESVASATTPLPSSNVYQYCLSSYDEENSWYDVVVTDDAGLVAHSAKQVVFEHDIDTPTGYRYNVMNGVEANENHSKMLNRFHRRHQEVVEYQYYSQAAAHAAAVYFGDKELQRKNGDWTVSVREFHRFYAIYDITIADLTFEMKVITVENRDFGFSAFSCWITDALDRRYNIWSFIEREDAEGFQFNALANTEYNKKVLTSITVTHDESSYSSSYSYLDRKHHITDAWSNFNTATRKGSVQNIYNTDLAHSCLVHTYNTFSGRADFHDLRIQVTDIDEDTIHCKIMYFDFWYDITTSRINQYTF